MTGTRGWKGGVYNPGFPPDKAYIERKAKEFAEAGLEWPEIKGVQFKRTKNQHKPLRNVVTRVVMVGFDPFNNSGLPEHIERQVVHDYWANEEQQFVLDWVNDAPAGEVRFGCLLNIYGTEDNYKPFPDLTIEEQLKVDEVDTYFDYAFRSDRVVENGIVKRDKHGPSGVPDEFALRRKLIEGMGLPPHLVSAGQRTATLRIPKMTNEVSYNGVKLSQIEIPESLNKTRDLVIALTKEVSIEDQPNLLTLFVGRGGNIRDLSDFFMIVKDAAPAPIRREPPVRSREDERGHEQCMRDSVRGIFPLMVLEKTGPDLSEVESDNPIFRSSLCPEVQTLEGELVPRVTGAYAVGADGVKRDLRDINLLDLLLGPVEGDFIDGDMERELQKTGLYRPQGGIDVFKVAALAKRNTPIEGELVDKGVEVRVIPDTSCEREPEVLTPEDIADREQAIQEASEGKLDYLLEGTQWDPKNRNK